MILGNPKVILKFLFTLNLRFNKYFHFIHYIITEKDFFPFLVTLFVCLFWSLEYGILCGIAANVSYILYSSARPQIWLYTLKVGF